VRLSRASLDGLPARVLRPGYDPADHGIGIVHLGIGAFHRAHQAALTDAAIALAGGDWRILGVSLRSLGVRDQLRPQDGLYTLAVRDGGSEKLRVIGSVADVLVAPEDPAAVVAAIAAPSTHVVTLTVTEKGYCHDPATGALLESHPDIAHDLANRDRPASAIGFLAAGLEARRTAGGGPLTIISCDNLPDNGRVLAGVMRRFIARARPDLTEWIEANVSYPSTMVDRIVPATTEADRRDLARQLGYEDAGLVKTEPFSQWVIEDRFAGPRPAWERVGAQIVDDVRPFEFAKLRMLNGSHSTLAYLGLARGHEFVDQAIADPVIAAVIDDLMVEAASTLPRIPGLDPAAYARDLKQRFANRSLRHRLAQIAMDGSQKLPQRLLATIADVHLAGGSAQAAAIGVAAWMRHFSTPFLDDPLAAQLRAAASDDPRELVARSLKLRAVFGDLGAEPWLRDLLLSAHAAVDRIAAVPA
jgi:fructuronate reductase